MVPIVATASTSVFEKTTMRTVMVVAATASIVVMLEVMIEVALEEAFEAVARAKEAKAREVATAKAI